MSAPTEQQGLSRLPKVHGTLIFEANWAGSLEQKAATVGVGALFWAVWVAMWMPALTFGLWLLGPLWGATEFHHNADDNALTLALIAMTGVFLGAMLSLWGTLQWLRGMDKPKAIPRESTTLEQLSAFHKVDPQQLAGAWSNRRLVIHHDSEGQVTAIEAQSPTAAESTLAEAPLLEQVPDFQESANAELWEDSQEPLESDLATGTEGAKARAPSAQVIALFPQGAPRR